MKLMRHPSIVVVAACELGVLAPTMDHVPSDSYGR